MNKKILKLNELKKLFDNEIKNYHNFLSYTEDYLKSNNIDKEHPNMYDRKISINDPTPGPEPSPVDFVFRVDRRPPEDVFQNGFTSWGSDDDFIAHITGESNIGLFRHGLAARDAFISTSETIDGALRFLSRQALSFNNPERELFYIYAIRPTENFYSAIRTANYLSERVNNGDIHFNDEEEKEEWEYILSDFMPRVYYQRELMAHLRINPEQISLARRIDLTRYINNLPTVTDDVFTNSRYVPGEAIRNASPYIQNTPPPSPETNSTIYAGDGAYNFIVTGGFACMESNPKNNINSNGKSNIVCYISDNNYLEHDIREHKEISTKLMKVAQKIPFCLYDKKDILWLNNSNMAWNHPDWAHLSLSKDQGFNISYDYGNKLTYKANNSFLEYSLTAFHNTSKYEYQYIRWNTGEEFSKAQQWKIIPDKSFEYAVLENQEFPDYNLALGPNYHMVLQRKTSSRFQVLKLYLKLIWNKEDKQDNIDDNQGNELVNNIEINIRWKWYGYDDYYYWDVVNNTSVYGQPYGEGKMIYNQNYNMIIWVGDDGSTYALTNNRANNQEWNWIRWIKINEDLSKEANENNRWYIHKDPYLKGLVRIYNKKDILWVQNKGSGWGGFFTTSANDVDHSRMWFNCIPRFTIDNFDKLDSF
ncbi:MAG: hypothetical protein ACRDCG_02715 [Mycoplasmoidaceae bacterium]